MFKKIIIVSAIIFAIVLSKFIFWQPTPNNEVVVGVTKAKVLPISTTITLLGNIIADQSVDVSAKTNGIIKNIYFKSGQLVKKDDLLFCLDNEDLKAKLEQCAAKLSLSKREYERYLSLVKHGHATRAELDKVTSQLVSAQAEFNYDLALLNQTFIRAPFDGRLGIRNVNIGQYISPGQPLVNIQVSNPLYVEFNVPEQYINQLNLSAKINLFEDEGLKIATAKINAVNSNVSLETRTLLVRALIDEDSSIKWVPGMYTKVEVSLSQPKNSILIPQSAVVYSPLGEFVYLVFNHHFKQVKVKTGEQVGDQVVIISGLNKEDKVVCAGQIKLRPGVVIKEIAY